MPNQLKILMHNRKQIIDEILPANAYGCYFRLVELEDAQFILSLRNHEKLSRYINPTSTEIEDQINWLKEYKVREKKGEDFYILCLKEDKKTRLGLNRIYDITGDTFEFGSWVYSPDAGPNMSIFGDLFVKSLAFEKLQLKSSKLQVKKENKRVLWYIKSFNPTLVGEEELSYYFELDYANFKAQSDKLLKLLNMN